MFLTALLSVAMPSLAETCAVVEVEGGITPIRICGIESIIIQDYRGYSLDVVPLEDVEEMLYPVPGVGMWAIGVNHNPPIQNTDTLEVGDEVYSPASMEEH